MASPSISELLEYCKSEESRDLYKELIQYKEIAGLMQRTVKDICSPAMRMLSDPDNYYPGDKECKEYCEKLRACQDCLADTNKALGQRFPFIESTPVALSPPNSPPPDSVDTPMARRAFGTKGEKISLLTNKFKVELHYMPCFFYKYEVDVCYDREGNPPVKSKSDRRRVLDSYLSRKRFIYRGQDTLFTVEPLTNYQEGEYVLVNLSSCRTIRLNDKRARASPWSTDYYVRIRFITQTPVHNFLDALRGPASSEQFTEAVTIFDGMLSRAAELRGYDPTRARSIGGGVLAYPSLNPSLRATQAGFTLNVDVSTTLIVQPGKVVDFLLANQKVEDIDDIDWTESKRVLKSLRIKTLHSNCEYKITGMSANSCVEQKFMMKTKSGNSPAFEISVYNYYLEHHGMELNESKNLPCLDVGKPERPIYLPLELCELIPLQTYTKSLSHPQQASLIEKTKQNQVDLRRTLLTGSHLRDYTEDPFIKSAGITISSFITEVEGRVLQPPNLKFGNGEDLYPSNGCWNYNDKKLFEPMTIDGWAIVNFSARRDIENIARDLRKRSSSLGMLIKEPFTIFNENLSDASMRASDRVRRVFESTMRILPARPSFLLCILPERENSEIYGPWKRRCLVDFGIATQCMAPTMITDQHLTNLLLKINAKMGGINFLPADLPIISKAPAIIFGVSVHHNSPWSDVPSVAAVVRSRRWPMISQYRASVCSQIAHAEIIDGLFDPLKDEGMIKDLLMDFCTSSNCEKLRHIIIFRDGVKDSMLNQVLDTELKQIMQACKFLDDKWEPRFVVIVAQRTHPTKFFLRNSDVDVPAGTIIDTRVCHPENNDFYLCAQNGSIATTRPTHYHVLLDQIGFSTNELQEVVNSLSYADQRSTTSDTLVAPIRYARLAAQAVSQIVNLENTCDDASSPSHSSDAGSLTQIPRLNDNVRNSMFFC